MRPILALMLLTGPALAESALDPSAPAQPGAVAAYLQARELYTIGTLAKDPLTVLTAARLLRGLNLTDTARQPDPATAHRVALSPLDPVDVLNTARLLDAGQVYIDLIEQVASDLQAKPQAIAATASRLVPGQAETWTLAFYGGSPVELAILGDGQSNLDLAVTDASGTPICLDHGNADTARCAFTLRDNGQVTVTVTNVGDAGDTYFLLTN